MMMMMMMMMMRMMRMMMMMMMMNGSTAVARLTHPVSCKVKCLARGAKARPANFLKLLIRRVIYQVYNTSGTSNRVINNTTSNLRE